MLSTRDRVLWQTTVGFENKPLGTKKIGLGEGDVRTPRFSKPLPYLWPKSGNFPRLIKNSGLYLSYLTLRSIPSLFQTCLRHRLHGRGFQSKRFYDLETASKTIRFQRAGLHGTYPTVYVKAISFSGLCASSIGSKFDQTRCPKPNPESSFSFSLSLLCWSVSTKKSTFQDISACCCGMALGL